MGVLAWKGVLGGGQELVWGDKQFGSIEGIGGSPLLSVARVVDTLVGGTPSQPHLWPRAGCACFCRRARTRGPMPDVTRRPYDGGGPARHCIHATGSPRVTGARQRAHGRSPPPRPRQVAPWRHGGDTLVRRPGAHRRKTRRPPPTPAPRWKPARASPSRRCGEGRCPRQSGGRCGGHPPGPVRPQRLRQAIPGTDALPRCSRG